MPAQYNIPSSEEDDDDDDADLDIEEDDDLFIEDPEEPVENNMVAANVLREEWDVHENAEEWDEEDYEEEWDGPLRLVVEDGGYIENSDEEEEAIEHVADYVIVPVLQGPVRPLFRPASLSVLAANTLRANGIPAPNPPRLRVYSYEHAYSHYHRPSANPFDRRSADRRPPAIPFDRRSAYSRPSAVPFDRRFAYRRRIAVSTGLRNHVRVNGIPRDDLSNEFLTIKIRYGPRVLGSAIPPCPAAMPMSCAEQPRK